MVQESDIWRLMRHDVLLGTITVEEVDFPWLRGGFAPEPPFTQVKPWFDEALALMEADHFERFETVYDRIPQELTLVSPTGPVADFLLHIDGGKARFRWSDEPVGG